MGERAAYRASANGKSLFMLRKQWYFGSTHKDLEKLVQGVASQLMKGCFGIEKIPKIGGGLVALRDDLRIGRLSMALLAELSSPQFDEVVEPDDINCDINDHGIFEIDLITPFVWEINHYPVNWDKETGSSLGEKKCLATFTFIQGKTLKKGVVIDWHVPDNWEHPEG